MPKCGSVDQTRDGQKSRLYKWEDQVVSPYGSALVPFAHAQRMVNYIWAEMGLLYPPTVERFRPNVVTQQASADRSYVHMHESLPTWVLIHELAHSMTSTHEKNVHGHNEYYVGVYFSLLEKFLGMDGLMLQHTATMCKVKFIVGATPIMLNK